MAKAKKSQTQAIHGGRYQIATAAFEGKNAGVENLEVDEKIRGILKRAFSERDICTKFITPALLQVGWDEMLQIREELGLTKGRIIVRGKLVTRGQVKSFDNPLSRKPGLERHPIGFLGVVE